MLADECVRYPRKAAVSCRAELGSALAGSVSNSTESTAVRALSNGAVLEVHSTHTALLLKVFILLLSS